MTQITRSDWLITSHVTQITGSDWLITCRVYEREPCDCGEPDNLMLGQTADHGLQRLRAEPFTVHDYTGGREVSSVCTATEWSEWSECTQCEENSTRSVGDSSVTLDPLMTN